jgi:hypothetical protein
MEKDLGLEVPQPVRAHLLPKSGSLITMYAKSDFSKSDNVRQKLAYRLFPNENSLLDGYMQASTFGETLPLQYWGQNNNFPQRATNLNLENPISSQLMQTKTDFAVGKKLITYYERVDDKGDKLIEDIVFIPEIDEWLEENEMIEKLSKATLDYFMVGNSFWAFRTNKAQTRILRADHIDPNLVRVGQVRNIEPLNYAFADFLSGIFHNVNYLPVFDPYDPLAEKISVSHIKNYVPGSYFYGVPDWIGAEKFIRLLNEIPKFHTSGLERTHFLRWHIQIPEEYFSSQGLSIEDEIDAEKALKEHFDTFLAGAENNGKSIVTKLMNDHTGKPINGVKIEALKPELFDSAYIELFNQGMMAVCSAHGIDPALAGVILNGQLSAGSHLRNGYNMYELLKVPRTRRHTLKPLYQIATGNRWLKTYAKKDARLRFGFIGSQITKLDENSEGAKDIVQ